MTGRPLWRWAGVGAVVLALVAWFFLRRESPLAIAAVSAPVPTAPSRPATSSAPAAVVEPALEGESHLADDLNAPGGTIQRDIAIVEEIFATWQTNFPRTGNPVGENAEITAALAGDNELKFAFLSRRHRAINAKGELCDRWGTPFRFHQLSGRQMEIRSAGPDRKFGTPDDVGTTPGE